VSGRRTGVWLTGIWLLLVAGCGGGPGQNLVADSEMPKLRGDPEYRLGVADVVSVTVKDNPTFSAEQATVRPDGNITLPLIDDIRVVGRTPSEVKQEVVQKLEKFIKTPIVTVTLVDLRSYEFFVLGQVHAPNRYTANRFVTVLQALSMAGGLTPFADNSGIVIVRRFQNGEKRILFDYGSVVEGAKLNDNIYLQSGDVVVVP
jgi:polysaccharide export outer membrane protein